MNLARSPSSSGRVSPRASAETNPLAAHNIHRYHGGLLDKTTSLTRYGVRWYNPATGRFTTPDPSGQEQHPSLYAAVNPCNNTDPTGENPGEDLGMRLAIWVHALKEALPAEHLGQ